MEHRDFGEYFSALSTILFNKTDSDMPLYSSSSMFDLRVEYLFIELKYNFFNYECEFLLIKKESIFQNHLFNFIIINNRVKIDWMVSLKTKMYSPLEEKINVYSHALGFILGSIGLIFLLELAIFRGDLSQILSFGVFGLSMMILFAASTLYHRTTDPIRRSRLRIFDHASIYALIAGTYTPFCLVTLPDRLGLILFAVVWAFALLGICIKLFFTGRFSVLSTLMYLFMGWMMVFLIKPLYQNLASEGLYWIFAGGLAYTLGAILYSIKRIPFNHASFHILVLIGCFCHYIAIYLYVI